MTCIVGLKTRNGVLLGGDALGSNGYSGTAYQAPKVFRLSPQVAVGYTTSFRMGQVIEHHLKAPALHAVDERKWAIADLVPALRQVLKFHGYAKVENTVERGGTFLLAIRGRLFSVQDDFSVLEAELPYDACGSGEAYALGAMRATYMAKASHTPRSARAFLTKALDAASEFAVGVAPPYSFVTTLR